MKASVILSLASVALAAPAANIEKRQMTMTANELTKGSCKEVTFIWVRGTTELGNLGEFVGGRLYPELKKVFPSLAVEGVAYGAGVPGNLLPGGGDPAGIKEATKDYNLAASKCPDTTIIGGGYSQGAAITHRAVEALPESVKSRIAGITLYGDTQFKQDKGQIKNFPPSKVKTFCNGYQELKSHSSDGVCNGMLMVNYGHMSYGDSMKPGAAFLKAQVDAFKSSGSKGSKESKGSKGSKGSKDSKDSTEEESSTSSESSGQEEPATKTAKESKKPKSAKGKSAKGSKTSMKVASVFDGAAGVAAVEAALAPVTPAVDAAQAEQLSKMLAEAKAEAAPIVVDASGS
ncbi:hypothetical protein FKW77_009148 [Venturia effusa]|uniref:Cutinase n=1 Tax=Venturia effusa TaxID=50376 RepID=A0A517LCX5_9PEZI|nr:hypothetical protein FKW77_009148 [Venturia effusa]